MAMLSDDDAYKGHYFVNAKKMHLRLWTSQKPILDRDEAHLVVMREYPELLRIQQ